MSIATFLSHFGRGATPFHEVSRREEGEVTSLGARFLAQLFPSTGAASEGSSGTNDAYLWLRVMGKRIIITDLSTDPVEVALRQARRERRKGHHRKSMLLLRRAAFESEQRPGLWTRYGLACMKGGKVEDGRKAFAQAVWLQDRLGRHRCAAVTQQVAKQAEQGKLPGPYA